MKMEKAKDATPLSRRNHLFRAQRFDAEDYGYAAENPVCTEGASDSERYLSCLRTPDGAPYAWKRTGFVCLKTCHGIDNVLVDSYDLFVDHQYACALYICPYGHGSNRTPKGIDYLAQTDASEQAGQPSESATSPERENQTVSVKKEDRANQPEGTIPKTANDAGDQNSPKISDRKRKHRSLRLIPVALLAILAAAVIAGAWWIFRPDEPMSPAPVQTKAAPISAAATITEAPAPKAPEVAGYVQARSLNLRKEPNLESVTLGTFSQGTAITILGEEGDWYRVAAGDQEGYMMKAFVTRVEKPPL